MIRNPIAFFQSQSDELALKANRVRNLIGDSHWYTDGAFKEALILDALRCRLPSGLTARRGFVLTSDLSVSSKEQDCVIADRHVRPPVFEAVDFHMVTPHNVNGLVSVKTRLKKESFVDAVMGLSSALRIVADEPLAENPFAAIFFFDEHPEVANQTIVEWIRETIVAGHWPVNKTDALDGDRPLGPLYVFSVRHLCIRIDKINSAPVRVRFYTVPNIASAIFLHLVESTVAEQRKVPHAPSWSVLDDDAVATQTMSFDL